MFSMMTRDNRIRAEYADMMMYLIEDIGFGKNTIIFKMEFDSVIDEMRLRQALLILKSIIPILSCRFVPHRTEPYWEKSGDSDTDMLRFTADDNEFLGFENTPVDPVNGNILSCCIRRSGERDSLIIKTHHSFCDVGGIKELVYLVSDIYTRLKDNPGYRPQFNHNNDRDIDQVMNKIPLKAYPEIFINSMREFLSNIIPLRSKTLPLDEQSTDTGYEFLTCHINGRRYDRIVSYGKMFNATLNDMLMASFLRSIAGLSDSRSKAALRAIMTVDLRLWYLKEKKGGSICNLSSFEYLNIGSHIDPEFDKTLGKISGYTARRKQSWFGMNQLLVYRYVFGLFPFRWWEAFWSSAVRFGIKNRNIPNGLSNFGIIDKNRILFETRPVKAYILPPVLTPPSFAISVSSYDSSLTLSTGVFDKNPLPRLMLDGMIKELLSK